jgi:hypothetical protein
VTGQLVASLNGYGLYAALAFAWAAVRRARRHVQWSRAHAREVRRWVAETNDAWARAIADAQADAAAYAALRAARQVEQEPTVRALRPLGVDVEVNR